MPQQKEIDRGWERIKEQHKVIEDHNAVVGITQPYTYPDDGTSGAYVGAIHEFGLGPHSEKKWLSGGISEKKRQIMDTLFDEYQAMVDGTSTGMKVLEEGARHGRDAVRAKIEDIDLKDTERLQNQTRGEVWPSSKSPTDAQFSQRSSATQFV